jgi:hypothetical protein
MKLRRWRRDLGTGHGSKTGLHNNGLNIKHRHGRKGTSLSLIFLARGCVRSDMGSQLV